MFKLEGKTALITGATGGIGKEIVRAFYQAGATIIATGTSDEKLSILSSEFNSKIYPKKCNLKNRDEVTSLIPFCEELVGCGIDILVCNAGITRDNLSIRMSLSEWYEVIDLNLSTTFILNQCAVKSMMKRKYGRVINVTSVIGHVGNLGQPNYAAAKAGILAMTKSIALEVASRNITINCIAPGFIDTPMTEGLDPDYKEKLLAKIPMKKMGTPKNIADAALFLASSESEYITGTTLHVNGGMLML